MRILQIGVLVLPLFLMACGDDGGDGSTPAVDADTTASIDADTSGGGGVTVPTTITMTTGFGGAPFAGICQNLVIGGGIALSLVTAPQCPGGEAYLTWYQNTAAGTYFVVAGKILTENNDGAAVAIQSTSVGAVTKTGADEDTVVDLVAGADITIETADHAPITFSFTGADLTLSAFTAR